MVVADRGRGGFCFVTGSHEVVKLFRGVVAIIGAATSGERGDQEVTDEGVVGLPAGAKRAADGVTGDVIP